MVYIINIDKKTHEVISLLETNDKNYVADEQWLLLTVSKETFDMVKRSDSNFKFNPETKEVYPYEKKKRQGSPQGTLGLFKQSHIDTHKSIERRLAAIEKLLKIEKE